MEALSAEATGLAMAMNLNRALLGGMSASGRLPYQLSTEQIDALINGQRRIMQSAIRQQMLVSMAYTYQTLSDGELQRYVEFLKTDAGQRFYVEMLVATEAVISDRAHDFGQALMSAQASLNL